MDNSTAAPGRGSPSVKKAVALGVVARVVLLPVSAGLALANTSVSIAAFGTAIFATIAIAIAPTQMLPFSDLGIAASVVNAVATGRDAEATVLSALRMLACSGLAIASVGISGATVFSWTAVLGVDAASIWDWCIAAALVVFATAVPLGVSARVLIGLGRNHQLVWMGLITPSVVFLTTVSVIWTGSSPAYAVLGPATGVLLTNVSVGLLALRHFPFRVTLLTSLRVRRRGLLRAGLGYMTLTLATVVPLQAIRPLTAHAGAQIQEVALLAIITQLYLPFQSLVSTATASAWPRFSADRAAGRLGPEILWKGTFWTSVFSLPAATAFVLLAPALVNWISDASVSVSRTSLLGVGFYMVVQSAQLLLSIVVTEETDIWFQARFALVGAILALSAVFVATSQGVGSVGSWFTVLGAATLLAQTLPSAWRIRRVLGKVS